MARRDLRFDLIADTSRLSRGLTQAQGQFARLEGQIQHSSRRMTAAIGAVGVGGAAAAGFAKVIKDGIAFNSTMESNELAMRRFIGSTQGAQKYLKDLFQIAKETPFEFTDLTLASRRLLAFGLSAKQTRVTLAAVGDAIAAMGGNAESIDRVTLALGQMQAKGKVSGEELLQLTEAGIPATQILKEELKLTNDQVAKIGELSIPAGVAIGALTQGMTKRFEGAAAEQATTWAGMTSTLKDNWAQATGSMTDDLFKEMKRWVPEISNTLGLITQIWSSDSGWSDLNLGDKLKLTADAVKRGLSPLVSEAKAAIDRMDLGQKLSDGLERAAPAIANAAAKAAGMALKAFVAAFREAGAWGKLITLGFLASKFGAFKLAGSWAAGQLSSGFKASAAKDKGFKAAGNKAGDVIGNATAAAAAGAAGSKAPGLFSKVFGGKGFLGGMRALGAGAGQVFGVAFAGYAALEIASGIDKALRRGDNEGHIGTFTIPPVGGLLKALGFGDDSVGQGGAGLTTPGTLGGFTGFDPKPGEGISSRDVRRRRTRRRKPTTTTDFAAMLGDLGGDTGGGSTPSDARLSEYGDPKVIKRIIAIGRKRGVPLKVILAAIETGIVESGLKNVNYGDADSLGWRQERASLYKNPLNLEDSINRFFNEAVGMGPGKFATAGQLAAAVQRPAAQFRGRYDEVRGKAQEILNLFTGGAAGGSLQGVINRIGKPITKFTGGGGGLGKGMVGKVPALQTEIPGSQAAYEQIMSSLDLQFALAKVADSVGGQQQALEAMRRVIAQRITKIQEALKKKKLRPETKQRLTQELVSLVGQTEGINEQIASLVPGPAPLSGELPANLDADLIASQLAGDKTWERSILEYKRQIRQQQYDQAKATPGAEDDVFYGQLLQQAIADLDSIKDNTDPDKNSWAEALRNLEAEMRRNREIAEQAISTNLAAVTRWMADSISGEIGGRMGQRAATPGAGSVYRA